MINHPIKYNIKLRRFSQMKSTKLTSALLMSSLLVGGVVNLGAGVVTASADAVSSQPWNQPEDNTPADPDGHKQGVENEANDHVVTPDMTEVKTESQDITRTIKYDYSGVEKYMKPGVDYPKEKTQTVTVMRQAVKGTNGDLNWGQWSIGTFPKVEIDKLSGVNATTKLVPVNASGATISEVPQQDVKHGDQNSTVTIKFKAIDTSKNDANQTHTAADDSTMTNNADPVTPEIPARPAEIQSDPAEAPSDSSSSSSSSDSSSSTEKPDAANPSDGNSSKSDSDTSKSDRDSSKTDTDPSTDANGTPDKSNSSSDKSNNSSGKSSDTSKSTDGQSSDQSADGQTSNGLPVQNNGTSKTQSKTEQQPNTGNLPQTGDAAFQSVKAAAFSLAGLAMLGSAAIIRLKKLF